MNTHNVNYIHTFVCLSVYGVVWFVYDTPISQLK